MKIATFNVNSLRARIDIVSDWLKKNTPDILCVQETKVQDKDFPTQPFDDLGYNCVFAGQKSYNGVAIFSSEKPVNIKLGFNTEPNDKPRLIIAKIQNINIVNTYVPQGDSPESEKFQYKLEWFDRLLALFKKNFKPADPIIWTGDFNIAPEAIDVYDPKALFGSVCYHPLVQEKLNMFIKWGFTDIFRLHCKEPNKYTFWDYRIKNALARNLGWRLDHILATAPLVKKSKDCYIDKAPRTMQKPSDHTPLVANFS